MFKASNQILYVVVIKIVLHQLRFKFLHRKLDRIMPGAEA